MCNKNKVFPAIIERDGEGYFVSFPDLDGCFSSGETVIEAFLNAREALALYLYDLTEIPTASDIDSVVVSNSSYVMLVTPDEDATIKLIENVDISEILECALKAKELTQYRVAKILGLSESYVSRIVKGERTPSAEIAQKLAALLDFDWRVFFVVKS